jgi:NitT/TauT family transport system substrate-binding protein
MGAHRFEPLRRREFLHGLTLAGTATLVGAHRAPVAAEPPPETTTLRLGRTSSICQAPQYVALFEAEGFTDVKYVGDPTVADRALVSGDAHMGMLFVGPLLVRLDEGAPVRILAGGHIGCLELLGHEPIRSIRDLKGKRVAVTALGSPSHVFLATIMAHLGFDPRKDVTVVPLRPREAMRAFEQRRVDAYIGSPPFVQELRARKIGQVVVNSSVDRPWSQYFCCVVAGHREFVQKNPIATKRALRAILKGADICALEPERAAELLTTKGFTPRVDYALQSMKDVPYGKWREYEPEDTVRFYALRLHEVGMIKSSPQKIIAQGTDWRFLNELRKELKG